MSHLECSSYKDAKKWFDRECPVGLQDKVAHVLTGDETGEIDDTLPENQLLLRYLRDHVKLFEEVYDAKFTPPSCPSAVTMPSAENFIESFNQFVASPDLLGATNLGMALNQFQQASKQANVDFPKTFSALQTNLDEIEKALEEAEKEKFLLQYNETLIKGRQNIADLEDKLRGTEEEHKRTTEFLTGLLQRKKTGKTEISSAERTIVKINRDIENLKRIIKKAKVQLEKEELALAPNSFQIRQTCENILRTMRQSFPEIQKELNDFQAAVAKKIKSSAEKIPLPVSGSKMVYLCIRRQHEIYGRTGADLDEASAREFAELGETAGGDSHPSESDTDKFLKAIKLIVEFTISAIKKVKKSGGAAATATETASSVAAEHPSEHH